jgi:hypothetical protein
MTAKRIVWLLVIAAALFILYLMIVTPAGPLVSGP